MVARSIEPFGGRVSLAELFRQAITACFEVSVSGPHMSSLGSTAQTERGLPATSMRDQIPCQPRHLKPPSELLCLEGRHADRQTADVGGRQPGAPKKLG